MLSFDLRSLPRVARAGIVLPVFVAAMAPSTAEAGVIHLSQHSSDSTDAGVLDARVSFDVLDAGSTLRLTVFNDTANPNAYFINQVYFNASDDFLLSLTSPASGWALQTNQQGGGVFGTFDYALIGGNGNDPDQVAPGGSLVFELDVVGGTAVMADFTASFSVVNNPNQKSSVVSLKFVRGPGDDSAFGASVPAPASTALMIAAGLIAARRRRD